MKGRGVVRRMADLLVLLLLIPAAWVLTAVPVEAHQDGCHRWHSCPSDTGSYVCGDLGYDDECGFSAPAAPKVIYDYREPRRPQIGTVQTGAAGVVRIPVAAESGSDVVVRMGPEIVANLTGTGGTQWVTLRTSTGTHRFSITATDSSGNRSQVASVTAAVDATPPPVNAVILHTASPEDSRTEFRVVTDPSTAYQLKVDGRLVRRGSTSDGSIGRTMSLPDGRHKVAVELTDELGNRREVARVFDVDVPALTVAAKALTEPSDGTQVFQVQGTPGARSWVGIPGAGVQKVRLTDGTGLVRFALRDGSYPHGRVHIVDSLGRRGTSRIAGFLVDTAAPQLRSSALSRAARDGILALLIAGDEGSEIAWRVTGPTGRTIKQAAYTSDGAADRFRMDLEEGVYAVEVTATDTYGNRSNRQFNVKLEPDPVTTQDLILGSVAILVLLLLLLLPFWLWWANRRRIAAWRARRRARAAQREAERQHGEAMTRHRGQLAAFEVATQRYGQADRDWLQRKGELEALLERARTDRGGQPDYAAVKLRTGERVYRTVRGSMIDMRSRHGSYHPTIVDHGELTVTSERVVFNGAKKREWALGKLESLRHLDEDGTMMKVSTRKNWSGFTYGDAETTRLCIDLAVADMAGSRATVVESVGQRLHGHEKARPTAPTHPGPAPERPEFGNAPTKSAEAST